MGRNRQPSTASTSNIDDIIAALRDDKMLEAIGSVIENKLQSIITDLKVANATLTSKVGQLESALNGANKKIDLLEAYTRADNLVIVGLPAVNFADAVSTHATDSTVDINIRVKHCHRAGCHPTVSGQTERAYPGLGYFNGSPAQETELINGTGFSNC